MDISDAERHNEEVVRSYLVSHGGKVEFYPYGESKSWMVSNSLWLVAECSDHPKSRNHAQKCRIEIATLTPKGVQEGKRLISEMISKADTEAVRKYLNLLPHRVRSLFLCLLTQDNQILKRSYSEQLQPISNQVFEKVKLALSLPKYPMDILFPSIIRFWEYISDNLTYLGLGRTDGLYHVTAGWRSTESFDTCPEVCDFLRNLTSYDPTFLVKAGYDISQAISVPLAKLALLSLLKTKESVSRLDLKAIDSGFPGSSKEIEEFIADLQQNKIASSPNAWDRIKLLDEIPFSLIQQITDEATRAIEHWWNTEKEFVAEPVVQKSSIEEDQSLTVAPQIRPVIMEEKPGTLQSVSIFLGHTVQGEKAVWSPFEETNQHLLVCGFSGSGKTQSLKTIVMELERHSIPSIIMDFKGGTFRQGNIVDISRITINPLELDYKQGQDPTRAWTPKDKALNVSHAFDKIFSLGDQQRAKLADAFLESYHARGITDEDSNSWVRQPPTLDDVEKILTTMEEDAKIRGTISTLKGRLQTILWKKYFSSPTTLPLSQMVSKTTCVDFGSVKDQEAKTAIAEVVLQKLLGYMYTSGPSRKPRFFIVIDEGHRLGYERSAMDLLAREAREYGVGLIVASQFMKDFKKEVLGNLSTIVSYQMNPSEEARYVADQLGPPVTEKYLQHELKEPFRGVVKMGKTGIPQKFRFVPFFERTST